MTFTLALAAVPVSLTKLILCTLILLLWAKWSTVVDKDAAYYRIRHRMWNAINLGAAAIAFTALFLIPIFVLGFILAALLVVGAAAAYFNVRNKAVPAKFRWELDFNTFHKLMLQRRQAKAEKTASFKFKSASGAPKDLKPVPLPEDDKYEAHLRVEEILEAAFARHAQGLEISGGEAGFQVTLHVDGVEYRHSKLTAADATPMIDYLKLHAGLDVSDRRKQLTGACSVEGATHGKHELKVMTSGSTRGFQCQVWFDPLKQVSIPFEELGLLEHQLKQLQPVLEEEQGVVIVATGPKQGRTTTLYALTAQHDPYTMDIHIIEPQAERELDAVSSHRVAPAEQAPKLRSVLLRDPHVVTVAAVTDQPTARQIAEGAAEGKRIYAGLRADDTFSALKLWVKAVGDPEIVSKSLRAIVAQRLVRKLCTVCRQKYKPDAAALKKLNLPADRIKELYKEGGKVVLKNEPEPCPACHGIGYMGRTAAFEVMVLDDEARKMIKTGQLDALRAHVRRRKTLWLEEAALQKVVAGLTSIREAMRAMGHEQKKPEAARERGKEQEVG